MTRNDKITTIKAMLGISGTTENDTYIGTLMDAAEHEILGFKYSLVGNIPDSVDFEDEMIECNAVVTGFAMQGMENQTSHLENGISRYFHYSDMIDYIHNNITPIARIC